MNTRFSRQKVPAQKKVKVLLAPIILINIEEVWFMCIFASIHPYSHIKYWQLIQMWPWFYEQLAAFRSEKKKPECLKTWHLDVHMQEPLNHSFISHSIYDILPEFLCVFMIDSTRKTFSRHSPIDVSDSFHYKSKFSQNFQYSEIRMYPNHLITIVANFNEK